MVCSSCLKSDDSDLQSVYVPIYTFDPTAQFQSVLTKQLASSGRFMPGEDHSGWVLSIRSLGDDTDFIGWKYDAKGFDVKPEKNLMPIEARRSITLEVHVLDSGTHKPIYEPFQVTANGEYDFIDTDSVTDFLLFLPSGQIDNVRQFSLGQLDSQGAGSQNISDYIYNQLSIQIIEHLLYLKETAGLPWR